jgi:hypothetical protein
MLIYVTNYLEILQRNIYILMEKSFFIYKMIMDKVAVNVFAEFKITKFDEIW